MPWPRLVRAGHSGVGSTFDIYCLTTGSRITAATYWYEAEEAELIAAVVALALELSPQPDTHASTCPETDAKLKAFERQHHGPYLYKEFVHENVMAEIGVACFSKCAMVVAWGHRDDAAIGTCNHVVLLELPPPDTSRQAVGHIAKVG